MNYTKVDAASLHDFADFLMNGVVYYDTICYNSNVSDVTVGGIHINKYLPKEYHSEDGTVRIEEPTEGNLLELLAASDGKDVAIYNYYGEVFRFTIEDRFVKFKSFEIFEEI